MTASRRRWATAELVATARAAALAVVIEVAVRTVPLHRLAPRLGVRLAGTSPTRQIDPARSGRDPASDLSATERRDCRAVARLVRRWPTGTGTCLREALLYGHALRRLDPLLHLGAGQDADRVVAHAWLSFDGATLGRRAGVLELTGDGR